MSGAISSANESVPYLDALRQDVHVQQQVQPRLLELNKIATSGMSSKISHHKLLELGGHKSLSCPGHIKKGSHMTS